AIRLLREFGVTESKPVAGKSYAQWQTSIEAIVSNSIDRAYGGAPDAKGKRTAPPTVSGQVLLPFNMSSLPYLPPPPPHIAEMLVQTEANRILQSEITHHPYCIEFIRRNPSLKSKVAAIAGRQNVAHATDLFRQFVQGDSHKLIAKLAGDAVKKAKEANLLGSLSDASTLPKLREVLRQLVRPSRDEYMTSLLQQGAPGWWVKILAQISSSTLPEHLNVEQTVRKELAGRKPKEYFPTTADEAERLKNAAASAKDEKHFFFRKEVKSKKGSHYKYQPIRVCDRDPNSVYFMIENKVFVQKKAHFKADNEKAQRVKGPADLRSNVDWLKDVYDKWNTPSDLLIQAYANQIKAQQQGMVTAIAAIGKLQLPKTAKLLNDNFPSFTFDPTDLKTAALKWVSGIRDHEKLGECSGAISKIVAAMADKSKQSELAQLTKDAQYKEVCEEIKANPQQVELLKVMLEKINGATNAVSLILNPQRRETVMTDLMQNSYLGEVTANQPKTISDSYAVVRDGNGKRVKWNSKQQGTPPNGIALGQRGELIVARGTHVLALGGKKNLVQIVPCTADGTRINSPGWGSIFTRPSNLR
ncbi:MAG: hypothetical protein KC561_09565, partial [Myxococcales bacterium]|nr:hypothetical protein [Myxococcales bacterium]